ncbi:MAG: hypothetical protein ACI4BG_01810, partial [Prevotella sp.]
RNAYYRHLDNVVILRDNIFTARGEGRLEGREEGRAEGRAEALKEIARKMKQGGMDEKLIMQFTGLKAEDIALL